MNPFTQNKPTNTQKPTQARRGPGGGWGDEDETPEIAAKGTGAFRGDSASPTLNGNNNNPHPHNVNHHQNTHKSQSEKQPVNLIHNNSSQNQYEYENRIVSELVQPGGTRLKQTDQVLSQFCKAAETLNVEVVGSILLHNLKAPIVWISKARTIFGIETLVKHNDNYYRFFRKNIKQLRHNEFLEDGINAAQLTKILDDVICYIEEQMNICSAKNEIDLMAHSKQAVPEIHVSQSEPQPIQHTEVQSNPKPAKGLPGGFKNREKKEIKTVNSEVADSGSPAKSGAGSETAPKQEKPQANVLDMLSGLDFSDKSPASNSGAGSNNNINNSPGFQNKNSSVAAFYNQIDALAQASEYLPQNNQPNYPNQPQYQPQYQQHPQNNGRNMNNMYMGNNHVNQASSFQRAMYYNPNASSQPQNKWNGPGAQQNIQKNNNNNYGVASMYDQIDSYVSEGHLYKTKQAEDNYKKFDKLNF